MNEPRARENGLDTLRALAIALVFIYHYRVFVGAEPTLGWVGVVGWVGVDLFFVLSGYLIGHQLFAGLLKGQRLSLGAFYARRALRTWPAFWVVLAAYFLFPEDLGGNTPPPLWRFLTFAQNWALQPGTAFSHAWSLCIEEQFYLVLPLAALLALRVGGPRWQVWVALAALTALGITARGLLWMQHGLESSDIRGYHPSIYYATLCRFDELLPGVAVAWLRNAHPRIWQALMQRGQVLLLVGTAATVAMLYGALRHYYVDGHGYGFFMTTFGYSLIAMAFALLMMAALSPASWLQRWRVPGAATLALWSYSIYLTHKAVGHVIKGWTPGWPAPLRLLLVTLVSLAVGALLFKLVEQRFMRLRARWCPSNFAPQPLIVKGVSRAG
jgi:peptidoglycan/LPS O-acetylase OafA/YrhL